MAKKLNDLREVLFSVMEDIRTGDCEPDRSFAICKVAGVLLKSAELELQAIEKLGAPNAATGFITIEPRQIEAQEPTAESLPLPTPAEPT